MGMRGQQSLLDSPEPVTVHGTLERVVFHNKDNGYTVLRLRVRGRADPVSVVGFLSSPQPGVRLSVTGTWVNDPRFGRQIRMEQCETLLPATLEGIRHYLGSGLIKGVGHALAGRIVDAFGDKTFEVLDGEPDRLASVRGISARLVDGIKAAWAEHKGIRDLILFLQPHGISTSYAVRIFRHYGADSLAVVRENPYRLAMDIRGIGFLTADTVAMKLGLAHDGALRIEAGLLYVLRGRVDEGHCFFPLEELVLQAAAVLGVEGEQVRGGLDALVLDERIVLETLTEENGRSFEAVYLRRFHHYESSIAFYLHRLLHSPKTVRFEDPRGLLCKIRDSLPLDLARGQEEAALAAMTGKVLVITGGPGTGKTTVINALIRLFRRQKGRILLAAPTGRAAKRMAETSGTDARTIHRLLEYSPAEDGFARNEDNPLACGLLVVDEASMLDTMLMFHLLKAVPLGATLVLVGDVNQLPSVGPGNVLKDIIQSGVTPVLELTEVFRQAADSGIIVNAHRINRGEIPSLAPPADGLGDFYFIRQEDPEKAADLVVDLVRERIPRRFGLDPVEDVQVLTPMHKGAAGVINLNKRLQEALNPEEIRLSRGIFQYRLNDKVMQIRNNYEKDVFNGDIGRICLLNPEDREATVRFDERNVLYAFDDLDEIVPAYAVSVHKSQGSEYPAVVLPILTQHYVLLQLNLLYTGVTRGKRLVILVGSPRALRIAVGNNTPHARHTWLARRLAAHGRRTLHSSPGAASR